MTSPFLRGDLVSEEGDVLHAYPDPLTHGAPWTDGVGHATGVEPGEVITEAQSQAQLTTDIGLVEAGLDRNLPWWKGLSDVRQDCLVDLGFNLGLTKLLTFTTFLGFVQSGQFSRAGLDLLGTGAAHELPTRYKRLAAQMSTGVHQP